MQTLTYQAADCADGVIRVLWGPMLGRRHDVTILGGSGLIQYLQQLFDDEAGSPYYMYGDPAYQILPWLLTPFEGALTPAQQTFDTGMRACRITVGWGFGRGSLAVCRLHQEAASCPQRVRTWEAIPGCWNLDRLLDLLSGQLCVKVIWGHASDVRGVLAWSGIASLLIMSFFFIV